MNMQVQHAAQPMKTQATQAQKLEQQMKQKGYDRYMSRQKALKSISLRNEPHRLITEALPKVSEELKLVLEAEQKKTVVGGRTFDWYKDLKDVDVDTLAYLGLVCIFDGILSLSSQTTTITNIGRKVELENWALGLYDFDKSLASRITKQVTKDHSSQRYRIKAARIIASREGYSQERWTSSRLIKSGSAVFNAVMKVTDLFEVFDANEGTAQTKYVVGLTLEAREGLFKAEEREAWAQPMYGPMINPPKPWTAFDTGCYEDPVLAASVPLVRAANREQRKAVEHHFEKYGTPFYVKALNALQATPLAINKPVLEVLEWVVAENIQINDKFPEMVAPEFPKTPENIDELPLEIVGELRREQKQWHLKLREIDANILNVKYVIDTANEMSEYKEFYMGWNFDFRGRMYPISQFNYHRDDFCKALFLFANGKPVPEDAKGWLYIHLANVGDFEKISKKSLEDRIEWVENNSDKILAVAEDPRSTLEFWSQADKPFQFLAACFEYKKMLEEGDEYVCHMPPAMDGTNSGVQHYSAALRSSEDAFLVNLIPHPECQDVYQAVADVSNEILKSMDTDEAKKWLEFGVGRKHVKRNVMTFGYSSVERGFTDQIVEDLMRPLQRDVAHGRIEEHPFGDPKSQLKHAMVLAKVNYTAVRQVVKSVSEGMNYLQTLVSVSAKEGRTARWHTPSGFPVVQQYTKWTKKKVKVYLWDREVKKLVRSQVTTREPDPYKIDSRKMRSSIAANWVHSLDSAHMQDSILLGLRAGLTDFFMIHDSFATQCADTWSMYHCIRAAFVNQYKDRCVFKDFERSMSYRMSEEAAANLPEPPAKGDLDIEKVLDSEYCFS